MELLESSIVRPRQARWVRRHKIVIVIAVNGGEMPTKGE